MANLTASSAGQPHVWRQLWMCQVEADSPSLSIEEPGVVEATDCSVFDWSELSAIAMMSFPGSDPDLIAFALINNKNGTRVLRKNGRIAGFSVNDPTHGAQLAWLEMLAVAPEFRRCGVGKRILQDYEHFVGRLGCDRVEFAVDRDNAAAIALYEAAGYVLVHRPGQRLTYGKQLRPSVAPVTLQAPSRLKRAWYMLVYRCLCWRTGVRGAHTDSRC